MSVRAQLGHRPSSWPLAGEQFEPDRLPSQARTAEEGHAPGVGARLDERKTTAALTFVARTTRFGGRGSGSGWLSRTRTTTNSTAISACTRMVGVLVCRCALVTSSERQSIASSPSWEWGLPRRTAASQCRAALAAVRVFGTARRNLREPDGRRSAGDRKTVEGCMGISRTRDGIRASRHRGLTAHGSCTPAQGHTPAAALRQVPALHAVL